MRKHCGVSDPLPPAAAVPLRKGDTKNACGGEYSYRIGTSTPKNNAAEGGPVSPLRRGTAVERSDRQGVARAASLLVAITALFATLVSFLSLIHI